MCVSSVWWVQWWVTCSKGCFTAGVEAALLLPRNADSKGHAMLTVKAALLSSPVTSVQ